MEAKKILMDNLFTLFCNCESPEFNPAHKEFSRFMKRCKSLSKKCQIFSLFDIDMLRAYDSALQHLASFFLEVFPEEEGIEIAESEYPEFIEVRNWLSTFDAKKSSLFLYGMSVHEYINVAEDEDLQFMLNILFTANSLR